jgi:hypothetical protein
MLIGRVLKNKQIFKSTPLQIIKKEYSVFSALSVLYGEPKPEPQPIVKKKLNLKKKKEENFRSVGQHHPISYADFDDTPPIEVYGNSKK